jgi:hypothetical protein
MCTDVQDTKSSRKWIFFAACVARGNMQRELSNHWFGGADASSGEGR